MKIKYLFIWLLPVFLLFSVSCEKDKETIPDTRIVNREIYNLMQEMYLWNDKLPDIDPDDYSSPEQLMDVLRYSLFDRWSGVMSKTEFQQYYDQGQMAGHGFLIGVDDSGWLRIAFVYKNTQAYREGVRRAWKIEKINSTQATPNNVFELLGKGDAGIKNTISFRTPEGTEKVITLTKELLTINSVLHSEVLQHDGFDIGYMVFQDFISTSLKEIDSTFRAFADANINALVIDLRYNGGGSVDVAEHIAGWITGTAHSDDVFYKLSHNQKNTFRDTTVYFPTNTGGLNPENLLFLTSSGTASASELLINGLEPFYTVIKAGLTTHGKPVGMYAFSFNDYDYTVLPVSFKYVNANDEGDFYSGIEPDIQAPDDLHRAFGDPEETMLKAALNYLNGNVTKRAPAGEQKILLPEHGGIYEVRRAY